MREGGMPQTEGKGLQRTPAWNFNNNADWSNSVSDSLSHLIRIFVAESDPLSSQLLAEALARDSGIEVLNFSSDPLEIIRILRSCPIDVLLVSARLHEEPERGLSLVQQLRMEHSGLKAVALLDSRRPELVVQAFRSGVCGVFCRKTDISLLSKCVAAVHRGEVWANSEELNFVLAALASAEPYKFESKRLALLTPREEAVVKSLVEGLTNREIAQTLAISQHTVKNYIFKIFDKLGVSNRVELAVQVLSEPIHARSLRVRPYEGKTTIIEDRQYDRLSSITQ
jgi:two-component system nitrate/nitrite response regulator NarL